MALAQSRGLYVKRPRSGRPSNPDSARQRLKAARSSKKDTKLTELTSNQSCTWETSTRGGLQLACNDAVCCKDRKCNQAFNDRATDNTSGPDIIGDLRRYYFQLDRKGKLAFLSERAEIRDHLEGIEDLRRKHVFDLYLESPETLASNLAQLAQGSILRLPKPRMADLCLVCTSFFFFATGAHRDTLYNNKFRKETGPVTEAAVLSPSEPRLPHQRKERIAQLDEHFKRDLIANFIKKEARGGLQLPNFNKTVLPYRSVMSVHAAYVRKEEVRLEAAAAKVVTDNEDASERELDELEASFSCRACKTAFQTSRERARSGDAHAVEVADPEPVPLVSKLQSRYFNRLLGPKGDPPVSLHKEICSLVHFRNCWTSDATLKKYIIRKWIPFAKCERCKAFKLAEQKEKDPETRRATQNAYDRHLAETELERRCYYSNRIRVCEPSVYLSLIMDGADQKFNQLPHYCERSHATDGETLQKVFVHGCIAHGREAYIFTFPPHVRQGHNVSCEMLWRVLMDVLEKEGNIPPILNLQLDNTNKTNKGRTLFAFLFLLVHFGVVSKILIAYLPPGHTHEDIDQLFSRIAEHLRRNDALTRTELERVLRESLRYNKKPIKVVPLQTAANISGWFNSMDANERPKKPDGCMQYRQFRIKKDKDGIVLLQARSSPIVSFISEPWQGLQPNTNSHKMFPGQVPNLSEVQKVRERNKTKRSRTMCLY